MLVFPCEHMAAEQVPRIGALLSGTARGYHPRLTIRTHHSNAIGGLIMEASQVAELIRAGLPEAQKVEVTGGEGKFEALVVSPQFAGMNAVKKHQTVYATVRDQIDSGEVHALSIRAFTPEDAPGA